MPPTYVPYPSQGSAPPRSSGAADALAIIKALGGIAGVYAFLEKIFGTKEAAIEAGKVILGPYAVPEVGAGAGVPVASGVPAATGTVELGPVSNAARGALTAPAAGSEALAGGAAAEGGAAAGGAEGGAAAAAGEQGLGASLLPYAGPAITAAAMLYGIHNTFGGGRPSTKDLQKKRSTRLAKEDPSYMQHLMQTVNLDESNQANQKKGYEATPEDYVGWWDDPNTPDNDYIWINKKAGPEGARKEDQGVGDLMYQPWFFENFENWENIPWESRIALVQAAMDSGTRKDSAGMIDFTLTPEMKQLAKDQGVGIVRYDVPKLSGIGIKGEQTVAPVDEGETGYTSDQLPTAVQNKAWGKIPMIDAQAWANTNIRKRIQPGQAAPVEKPPTDQPEEDIPQETPTAENEQELEESQGESPVPEDEDPEERIKRIFGMGSLSSLYQRR